MFEVIETVQHRSRPSVVLFPVGDNVRLNRCYSGRRYRVWTESSAFRKYDESSVDSLIVTRIHNLIVAGMYSQPSIF